MQVIMFFFGLRMNFYNAAKKMNEEILFKFKEKSSELLENAQFTKYYIYLKAICKFGLISKVVVYLII